MLICPLVLGFIGCGDLGDKYKIYITCKFDDAVDSEAPAQEYFSKVGYKLRVPTIEDYTFIGWSGPGIDGKVMEYSIPEGTMGRKAYTAHYKRTGFKITIKHKLGSAELVDGTPQKYTSLASYTLVKPSIAGYNFTGWSGGEISGKVSDHTIAQGTTGTKTYVAHFEAINYTINVFNIY